jgi:2Fe-2S ferredoxin
MHAVEDELLYDTAAERKSNSRLSCQLPVTDAIDGLVVNLPIKQV